MKYIRLIIKTIDKLSVFAGYLVSILIPIMAIIILYEVFLRVFLNSATIWFFDSSIFCYGYCGLIGGAYVMKYRNHVNVDIIYTMLSPRKKAIIDSITGLAIFYFLVLLIIYGLKEAIPSIVNGETSSSEWSPLIGHYKLVIPIGGFLLLLQSFANWLRCVYEALTGRNIDQ